MNGNGSGNGLLAEEHRSPRITRKEARITPIRYCVGFLALGSIAP
jgi:hypothetical protein